MIFHLSVLAGSPKQESAWVEKLKAVTRGLAETKVDGASSGGTLGQIVFVDAAMKGLDDALDGIDRAGRAVFAIVSEGDDIPAALIEEKVDDVLVHPFRPLEVLSKLRHYQQILMWEEVGRVNSSFAGLIEQLHEDLQLAERLQKTLLPARFPELKGFNVKSRYLAGLKAGGDHFDVAESGDGNLLSVVLSDSSSYGLSSAVLSVLMRVAMKLSAEEARSCLDTVARIRDELLVTLGERDRLSLFYGVVSRKDFKLRYSNLGTTCAFYAPPGQGFRELAAQGEPISRSGAPLGRGESELVLEPDGRLALISDGFVEAAGGPGATSKMLDRFRKQDAADILNELVFRVKEKFTEPDDLPAQDCTAIVMDVSSKVLRLKAG
jgi:hypothetical protein